jgi:hypothetical protein
MKPITPRPLALAALAAAAAALACAGGGGRRPYHDDAMDFGAIRSVAVVPFSNLSRDQLAADRVRDVFSTALLATGAVYVVPPGEVARGIGKVGFVTAATPSTDEVQKLGQALKVDAVVTGVVKEYGEIRSGTATGNVVSISVQLTETATGKVVWSGGATKGGIGFAARLLGGGGAPLNDVTEKAVLDVIDQLLK